MRTYGRDSNGNWNVVETDANGYSDYVYITTLIQTLKLVLGESPFFANRGIPAHRSVVQQVFPDYYVTYTQQLFSQYFASLIISKVDSTTPIYNVNIITNYGTKFQQEVMV